MKTIRYLWLVERTDGAGYGEINARVVRALDEEEARRVSCDPESPATVNPDPLRNVWFAPSTTVRRVGRANTEDGSSAGVILDAWT